MLNGAKKTPVDGVSDEEERGVCERFGEAVESLEEVVIEAGVGEEEQEGSGLVAIHNNILCEEVDNWTYRDHGHFRGGSDGASSLLKESGVLGLKRRLACDDSGVHLCWERVGGNKESAILQQGTKKR